LKRTILAVAFLLSITVAQVDTVWVRSYGGCPGGYDSATCVAIDRAQNVIVVGGSEGVSTSVDYAIVKYDPAGETAWTRRYWHVATTYEDIPYALAVDSAGSVYVTGSSYGGPSTTEDYATVKYSADGVRLWIARYNGPGSYHDEAAALVVDRFGSVCVTGSSWGADGYDIGTVKYDSLGVQQWVARYDDPYHNGDLGIALAVDDSGCVYVAGYRDDLYNYVTIKYGPNGSQRWVSEYNGPGDDIDVVRGVSVDSSGNVYVSGYSKNASGDHDFATVKYNLGGAQQWVARYNGPGNYGDAAQCLAVTRAGMVYVTGSSYGEGGDDDFATVKYDSQGNSSSLGTW
jgi:hypothetical protein